MRICCSNETEAAAAHGAVGASSRSTRSSSGGFHAVPSKSGRETSRQ
jgi:hypothetical protein